MCSTCRRATHESVQKALMEGKWLGSGSASGKSLVELADKLGGRQPKAKKSSMSSGLFAIDATSTKA